MLQRIQSFYLFLAFCALTVLGIFPVVHFFKESLAPSGKTETQKIEISALEEVTYSISPKSQTQNSMVQSRHWHYLNIVFWVLPTAIVLLDIFLFKRRSLQIILCWTSLFFILGLSLLIYLDINQYSGYTHDRTLGIGAFSISVSLLLILLARKQIAKDENLVRSVDRLR